jgi:hypothetical protein
MSYPQSGAWNFMHTTMERKAPLLSWAAGATRSTWMRQSLVRVHPPVQEFRRIQGRSRAHVFR